MQMGCPQARIASPTINTTQQRQQNTHKNNRGTECYSVVSNIVVKALVVVVVSSVDSEYPISLSKLSLACNHTQSFSEAFLFLSASSANLRCESSSRYFVHSCMPAQGLLCRDSGETLLNLLLAFNAGICIYFWLDFNAGICTSGKLF
jgi:hypothetical protein